MGWGCSLRKEEASRPWLGFWARSPKPSAGVLEKRHITAVVRGLGTKSLGRQDKNNSSNAQHHPMLAAFSPAGALLSATWTPLTLTPSFAFPSFPPQQTVGRRDHHVPACGGEGALPAVSSLPSAHHDSFLLVLRRCRLCLPAPSPLPPLCPQPSPSPLSRTAVINLLPTKSSLPEVERGHLSPSRAWALLPGVFPAPLLGMPMPSAVRKAQQLPGPAWWGWESWRGWESWWGCESLCVGKLSFWDLPGLLPAGNRPGRERGNLILGSQPAAKHDQSSGEEPLSLVSWGLPLTSAIQVWGFRPQRPRQQCERRAKRAREALDAVAERAWGLTPPAHPILAFPVPWLLGQWGGGRVVVSSP